MTELSIIPLDVAEKVPVNTLTEEIFAPVKRSELLDSLRTKDKLERRDLRGDAADPEIVAEMKRQLTRGVDYAWSQPSENKPNWPIRSGVRLESLAFSPWLKDVGYTYRVPSTKLEFVAHYTRWLGEGGSSLLKPVFGFDLENLFDQIAHLVRDAETERTAYLLLLSRHFRAAAAECMQLTEPCEDMPCSALDAFMVLAELQRMADMTAELRVAGTTVTKIRRQLRENKKGLKRDKAPTIIGRILDYLPVWQASLKLGLERFEEDGEYLFLDENVLELVLDGRAGNKASIVIPEEPLSFYAIELGRVPFAGVRRLSEAFDGQLAEQSQIAPVEAEIARLAFSILQANAPAKGTEIQNRIARNTASSEAVQRYLESDPEALRQTQRDADSASYSHIPPWYEHGGSLSFCHHFWFDRYFDAPFWTCFAERSFEGLNLSPDEVATMDKQMRRLERLIANREDPTDQEKIQIIEAVSDYACGLGALATDPAWSQRIVSMADFEASKRLSKKQGVVLRERLKLLEQFIARMRKKRYPKGRATSTRKNKSSAFANETNSKLRKRIAALQSRS